MRYLCGEVLLTMSKKVEIAIRSGMRQSIAAFEHRNYLAPDLRSAISIILWVAHPKSASESLRPEGQACVRNRCWSCRAFYNRPEGGRSLRISNRTRSRPSGVAGRIYRRRPRQRSQQRNRLRKCPALIRSWLKQLNIRKSARLSRLKCTRLGRLRRNMRHSTSRWLIGQMGLASKRWFGNSQSCTPCLWLSD
jgi:hypothetical protein